MIQNSTQTTQQIQTKTLAMNLTREAVEILYNIRDTNRTKWTGNTEWCWLKVDPFIDTNNDWCENDDWIGSWRYSIQQKEAINQQYFALEKIEWIQTHEDIPNVEATQLCQDSRWRYACQNTGTNTVITRAVHVIWLYHKNTTTPWWESIDCPNGNANSLLPCGWDDPKELRFCVHTYSTTDKRSHIQLCSMLTNFKQ